MDDIVRGLIHGKLPKLKAPKAHTAALQTCVASGWSGNKKPLQQHMHPNRPCLSESTAPAPLESQEADNAEAERAQKQAESAAQAKEAATRQEQPQTGHEQLVQAAREHSNATQHTQPAANQQHMQAHTAQLTEQQLEADIRQPNQPGNSHHPIEAKAEKRNSLPPSSYSNLTSSTEKSEEEVRSEQRAVHGRSKIKLDVIKETSPASSTLTNVPPYPKQKKAFVLQSVVSKHFSSNNYNKFIYATGQPAVRVVGLNTRTARRRRMLMMEASSSAPATTTTNTTTTNNSNHHAASLATTTTAPTSNSTCQANASLQSAQEAALHVASQAHAAVDAAPEGPCDRQPNGQPSQAALLSRLLLDQAAALAGRSSSACSLPDPRASPGDTCAAQASEQLENGLHKSMDTAAASPASSRRVLRSHAATGGQQDKAARVEARDDVWSKCAEIRASKASAGHALQGDDRAGTELPALEITALTPQLQVPKTAKRERAMQAGNLDGLFEAGLANRRQVKMRLHESHTNGSMEKEQELQEATEKADRLEAPAEGERITANHQGIGQTSAPVICAAAVSSERADGEGTAARRVEKQASDAEATEQQQSDQGTEMVDHDEETEPKQAERERRPFKQTYHRTRPVKHKAAGRNRERAVDKENETTGGREIVAALHSAGWQNGLSAQCREQGRVVSVVDGKLAGAAEHSQDHSKLASAAQHTADTPSISWRLPFQGDDGATELAPVRKRERTCQDEDAQSEGRDGPDRAEESDGPLAQDSDAAVTFHVPRLAPDSEAAHLHADTAALSDEHQQRTHMPQHPLHDPAGALADCQTTAPACSPPPGNRLAKRDGAHGGGLWHGSRVSPKRKKPCRVQFDERVKLAEFSRAQNADQVVLSAGGFSLGLHELLRECQVPLRDHSNSALRTFRYPCRNPAERLNRVCEKKRLQLLKAYVGAEVLLLQSEADAATLIRKERMSHFCKCGHKPTEGPPPLPLVPTPSPSVEVLAPAADGLSLLPASSAPEAVAALPPAAPGAPAAASDNCCQDASCPCFVDGVGCHIDGLNFCLCQTRCRNPGGSYVYNWAAIHAYRQEMLKKHKSPTRPVRTARKRHAHGYMNKRASLPGTQPGPRSQPSQPPKIRHKPGQGEEAVFQTSSVATVAKPAGRGRGRPPKAGAGAAARARKRDSKEAAAQTSLPVNSHHNLNTNNNMDTMSISTACEAAELPAFSGLSLPSLCSGTTPPQSAAGPAVPAAAPLDLAAPVSSPISSAMAPAVGAVALNTRTARRRSMLMMEAGSSAPATTTTNTTTTNNSNDHAASQATTTTAPTSNSACQANASLQSAQEATLHAASPAHAAVDAAPEAVMSCAATLMQILEQLQQGEEAVFQTSGVAAVAKRGRGRPPKAGAGAAARARKRDSKEAAAQTSLPINSHHNLNTNNNMDTMSISTACEAAELPAFSGLSLPSLCSGATPPQSAAGPAVPAAAPLDLAAPVSSPVSSAMAPAVGAVALNTRTARRRSMLMMEAGSSAPATTTTTNTIITNNSNDHAASQATATTAPTSNSTCQANASLESAQEAALHAASPAHAAVDATEAGMSCAATLVQLLEQLPAAAAAATSCQPDVPESQAAPGGDEKLTVIHLWSAQKKRAVGGGTVPRRGLRKSREDCAAQAQSPSGGLQPAEQDELPSAGQAVPMDTDMTGQEDMLPVVAGQPNSAAGGQPVPAIPAAGQFGDVVTMESDLAAKETVWSAAGDQLTAASLVKDEACLVATDMATETS